MIMSSSTSSTSSSSLEPSAIGGGGGAVVMERIRRVEMLRAELDRSLKMAAAAAASLNSAASAKRSPLCILFRAADSVHIQFSGSTRSSPIDLFTKPRSTAGGSSAVSRFTVSPTPNAVPPAAFGVMSPKCCNNGDGMPSTTTTNTPIPPSSPWTSSLSVLTANANAVVVANNTRQNGGTDDGDKCSDAIASAANAAAELLAPLSSTTTEDHDKNGKEDPQKDTADFVLPSPASSSSSPLANDSGGESANGGASTFQFKRSPVVGASAVAAKTNGAAAASSPASSVDSGVASPGAAGDFLLLNSLAPAFRPTTTHSSKESSTIATTKLEQCMAPMINNSPCWATVPRMRRRIFNFSGSSNNNGSSPLIDALALSMASGNKTTGSSTGAETGQRFALPSAQCATTAPVLPALLTLQKPPLKKKYGQQPIITTTVQQSSPLCQQPKSEVSFSSPTNGYNNNSNMGITVIPGALVSAPPAAPKFVTSSPSAPQMAIVSAKLVIVNNGFGGDKLEEDQITARRTPLSVVQTDFAVQRQLSDSVCYNKKGSISNSGGDNENIGAGSGTESDTALDHQQQMVYDSDAVSGLPPRAATVPPLRSILKKPRGAQQQQTQASSDSTLMMMTKLATANDGGDGGGQLLQQRMFNPTPSSPLPRNHLRRMPTRIVLERSVSDSLLDGAAIPDDRFSALQNSAAAAFNASILRKLSSSSPCGGLGSFDEQLEDNNIADHMTEQYPQPQNNNGSVHNTSSSSSSSSCPSSCSSETIDTDGSGQSATTPAPIAKKRVSFSECVHARYFRSNSSILGQRKKNEKKARKRTGRRCNSDIVHPSSTDDEASQQQEQSSHNHHNDCDESCPWITWKH